MPFAKIEVGKPAPIRVPPSEGIAPAIVGASLDVWGFMANLQAEEVKAWRKGTLRYGLFAADAIPIVLIDIAGFATFDLPLNFLLEPEDRRREFLESEPAANLVTLVLCDWPGGTVRGIRGIGVKPALLMSVKSACFDQVARYTDASQVSSAIDKLLARYTTDAMIRTVGLTKL